MALRCSKTTKSDWSTNDWGVGKFYLCDDGSKVTSCRWRRCAPLLPDQSARREVGANMAGLVLEDIHYR